MKANVTGKGAVLLGKYVACDAFDELAPLRVVTHAHADHLTGLRQSLKVCERVLMTNTTKDLIDVLRGPLHLMSGYVQTLDYGETIHYKEESLTLFKADHIPGAAQVLVEDAEGTKIVFTGDFRIDGTPVLDADVLVIEATYGSPSCKRSFKRNVGKFLVSLVEKGLKHDIVSIFGYHGKTQEVMQILYDAGIRVPFIVSEKVLHVSKVCERHGMRVGHLMLSGEKEAKELLRQKSSCIVFNHMASKNKIGLNDFRICVSGWEFNSLCRRVAEKEYVVALSDHSDFHGLLDYVRRSKPKIVITDNFRAGYAETLAKEIHKRFGVSTTALPKA